MLYREVPDVTFKTRVRDDSIGGDNPFRWQDVTGTSLRRGKRIVVFSLPGAFTPTCSTSSARASSGRTTTSAATAASTRSTASRSTTPSSCTSGAKLGLKYIKMLPDGSGRFTRLMGMLVDKDALGFGYRSWRYAMVVDGRGRRLVRGAGDQRRRRRSGPVYGVRTPENVLARVWANPVR